MKTIIKFIKARALMLLLLAFVTTIHAQKGIGTNNPNTSAALDITSTDKGFLKPRMTTTQRTNINSPATGLEVFDTTTNTTWYYNGTAWLNSGVIGDLRVVGIDSHITSDAGLGSNGTSVGSGHNNILIGKNTGSNLNTAGAVPQLGGDNVLIGTDAGEEITSGFRNVYIGTSVGKATTTGGRNVFIGFQAGLVNDTGSFNFFMGNNTGFNNTSGSQNLFLGTNSGSNNTIGSNNTFIGPTSGPANTEGANNIFMGNLSGSNVTTGNRNIVIGENIGVTSATGDNQLNIGGIIFGTGVNDVTGSAISTGRIGIGVAAHATDRLYIGGNLRTAGFITAEVAGSTIPDYVFEKVFEGKSKLKDSYEFKTLEEVEAFIKLNKHLPGVMGMKDLEMTKEGKYMVNLSKLSNQTLEKVEELFLHTISQQKKINALEQENEALKSRLEAIEKVLGIKKEN